MLPHLDADDSIPIAAINRGDEPLTGVSVTVYAAGLWLRMTHESIMQSVRSRIQVGTLHHGKRLVLGPSIQPKGLQETGGDNGEPRFRRGIIYISAQNFSFNEYLDLREDGHGGWLYRYMLYKMGPDVDKKGRATGAGKGEQLVEAVDWSSDVNYPNLTANKTWH